MLCSPWAINATATSHLHVFLVILFLPFRFRGPSFLVKRLSKLTTQFTGRNRLFSANMLILFTVMYTWFSRIFSGVSVQPIISESGLLFTVMKNITMAVLTFIFAFGGATIGAVTGGLKGQTTETGFSRGLGVGAVAGAVTGVQLMELVVNGEPFSKVALICSLVNGKIFMEWVSPAVLKAYQWQISTMETSLREISDIFEVNTTRGLSEDMIQRLPIYEFYSRRTTSETNCTICLQDFENGDSAKMLPSCRHFFHVHCIDEWLLRQGTCPVCRRDV